MADFIDFKRVEIGPEYLTARVRIGKDAPLYTSEDLQGTTRVYNLLPGIIDHVCLGDSSATFKDVMGDTELAHLLEHVTVELLAQTNIAGDITSGRTFEVEGEEDTYDIQLGCPDDVLVVGALSSAAWILQWAYLDGSDPEPDIDAIVDGLVGLVESLPLAGPVEYEEAPEDEDAQTEDVEIPDFIRAAAERHLNEEPKRSPEAVQSAQDDLDDDDEVVGDEYVFGGYQADDEDAAGADAVEEKQRPAGPQHFSSELAQQIAAESDAEAADSEAGEDDGPDEPAKEPEDGDGKEAGSGTDADAVGDAPAEEEEADGAEEVDQPGPKDAPAVDDGDAEPAGAEKEDAPASADADGPDGVPADESASAADENDRVR